MNRMRSIIHLGWEEPEKHVPIVLVINCEVSYISSTKRLYNNVSPFPLKLGINYLTLYTSINIAIIMNINEAVRPHTSPTHE